MKQVIVLALCSVFVNVTLSYAQVDYNKIILPGNATNVDIAERLVQLAWKNHPSNRNFESEVSIAHYNVKKAKSEWLDIFKAVGNLNEFNINPQDNTGGQNQFFPRYNFSATISLGMFVRIPNEVKRTKEMVKIADNNLSIQKLQLRQAVMQSYNNYIKFQQILRVRTKALEVETNSHNALEQKFREGNETFEKYSNSASVLDQTKIYLIEAEAEYQNAKLELEQMIGMKLEEAIN
jgi:outer membrane protein TolC